MNAWTRSGVVLVAAAGPVVAAAPAASAATVTYELACFYDEEAPTPTVLGASVIVSVTGAPTDAFIMVAGSTAAQEGSILSYAGTTDATGTTAPFDGLSVGVTDGEGAPNWPLELSFYADTNKDGLSIGNADDVLLSGPVTVDLVCPESRPDQVIDDLLASEAISVGLANALQSRIDAAAAAAEGGRVKPAIAQLRAVTRQVEAIVRAGHLELADGQALIGAIDREIARLGGD
jgi:hypothetical protein